MFFTNHMRVLTVVAQKPDARLRDIAAEVGITERAAHRIVSDLVQAGYIARQRTGSRNQYATLRHPHLDPETAAVMRHSIDEQPGATDRRLEGVEAGQFRALFDALPAGVAVADAKGNILAVNQRCCAILGRTEAELRGRSIHDHTHPDDIAADEERLGRLVSDEHAEYAREKRYLRPGGTIAWVTIRVVPTVDPQSGARLLVAHVTEISERRRRDQELAEAEERFRSAFDNAPIGMALVAPDGRWLKVNQAICEITGYSETDAPHRDVPRHHPPRRSRRRPRTRAPTAGRRDPHLSDGQTLPPRRRSHHLGQPLGLARPRHSGEPRYFIAQIKDITRQRQRGINPARGRPDRRGSQHHRLRRHVPPRQQGIAGDPRRPAAPVRGGPTEDDSWAAIAEDGTPLPAERLPAQITRLTGEEIDDLVVGFPSTTQDIRWLRISTRRLSNPPAPYQVILSYTDVTRRKQAERALALSQARLIALFRYIPAALSLRDLDGRYLHVTDSVARALGCTPEDLVGRRPSEHLSPELLETTLADDETIHTDGVTISRELTVKHADGSNHEYYVLKWPVLDENGTVAAFGAFSLDITEQKHAEQQLQNLLAPAP